LSDFDFDAAFRWARFDPGRTLARRADRELPFLEGPAEAGLELLLDTCVYKMARKGERRTLWRI
jgi:hypothetical protein